MWHLLRSVVCCTLLGRCACCAANMRRGAPPARLRAAPMLFWFLNNSLIYRTHSADVWLARFFGATAGVAATFLMLPLTPLVVETARHSRLLTLLFDFDANISSARPAAVQQGCCGWIWDVPCRGAARRRSCPHVRQCVAGLPQLSPQPPAPPCACQSTGRWAIWCSLGASFTPSAGGPPLAARCAAVQPPALACPAWNAATAAGCPACRVAIFPHAQVGTGSWDMVNLIAPGVNHLYPTAADMFGGTAAITGALHSHCSAAAMAWPGALHRVTGRTACCSRCALRPSTCCLKATLCLPASSWRSPSRRPTPKPGSRTARWAGAAAPLPLPLACPKGCSCAAPPPCTPPQALTCRAPPRGLCAALFRQAAPQLSRVPHQPPPHVCGVLRLPDPAPDAQHLDRPLHKCDVGK